MNQRLNWYQAVADCEQKGEPYLLVTVLGVAGSVPREPASKMVVTASDTYDTIGGGHLEYRVCQKARETLAARSFTSELAHFPLGASLGQCCGGSVSVLLEAQPGCEQQLVVFGAGHVARALITIMGDLPWRVIWVDERAEQFPDTVPANVRIHHTDDPVGDAVELCRDSQVLILTHNHHLDFELCRTLLSHCVHAGIGLIGSDTKARRFRQRLSHRGFDQTTIDSLRCPVGRRDIPGKRPMEVAVSMVAELLALTAPQQGAATRRGLKWQELRDLVQTTENGGQTA